MIESIALFTTLLWPLTELGIAFRRRSQGQQSRRIEGGGAAIVWLVALSGTGLAMATDFLDLVPMPFSGQTMALCAATLVLTGVSLRVYAVWTLNRYFTVNVAIREDHNLITHGLYRYIRHPGYTGLLLGFLGIGFISNSWLGITLATVPFSLVLVRRMKVEEDALERCFGSEYQKYRRSTRRLIPLVY